MLFCIVSMGLVSSCNKDKNENDSGSVGLVGDWKCVKSDVYDVQEDITTHIGVDHTLKLTDDGKWYVDGGLKGYYVTVGANNITLNTNEGVQHDYYGHPQPYIYSVTSSTLILERISSTWEIHIEFERL